MAKRDNDRIIELLTAGNEYFGRLLSELQESGASAQTLSHITNAMCNLEEAGCAMDDGAERMITGTLSSRFVAAPILPTHIEVEALVRAIAESGIGGVQLSYSPSGQITSVHIAPNVASIEVVDDFSSGNGALLSEATKEVMSRIAGQRKGDEFR